MKILIAEDDATNRTLLETFLAPYGDCHLALNGKEAVDAIRNAREDRQKFDLICMDLEMPQMDGHEAIREIRKQEAAAGIYSRIVKIIVITALTDHESVTKALQGRCDAYLTKPIDTAKLLVHMKAFGLVK